MFVIMQLQDYVENGTGKMAIIMKLSSE